MVLARTGNLLEDTGVWQFAYKRGYQVVDFSLLFNLVGQKCMEWSMPLVFGTTDIPKCFDELAHGWLLHTLLRKQVDPALAAWFIREARATVLHLRLRGIEVDPIKVTRGVAQGTKSGPKLCAAALHQCLQPVWEACQANRLGFCTESIYIPFVLFCDNIFIFAHSTHDFVAIADLLKNALEAAGWRLPDDRMECQANRHVDPTTWLALSRFKLQPAGHSFKLLGSKGSVAGTSHSDIVFKRHINVSAIDSRRSLWSCPGVSRHNKLSLMFKVASTSFCWSVGAWTVNGRELSTLRASFARPAKAALRLPRLWGDTDESFHRRLNRSLKTCLKEKQIPDLDVYVLVRLYDYAGHLARAISLNPTHLTGQVLNFRNAEWKQSMTDVLGHQGHKGRTHPWCWERQFHSYFKLQGEIWQEVALDKNQWHLNRSAWIEHMLGSRAASTNMGPY